MRSNAPMANRQEDVDLRFAQVSALSTSARPGPARPRSARLQSRIPGKDSVLSSSYRPSRLLDTNGKFFEKILLTRILYEANERGLMRDEKFGFLPRHSTSLQLVHLVERIISNFGEKRLTGAVFLEVTKAFYTAWIDSLLYKLTILNFPSYLVHTIASYVRDRTFEASFQATTSSRRGMRAGVAQGGLISPVLFRPHANMPTPSHHVQLALYAFDMAIHVP